MKARKYFILVGKDTHKCPFSMIFGDYEKSVVVDEKHDTSDYVALRVVTLLEDTEAAIMAALDKLNFA